MGFHENYRLLSFRFTAEAPNVDLLGGRTGSPVGFTVIYRNCCFITRAFSQHSQIAVTLDSDPVQVPRTQNTEPGGGVVVPAYNAPGLVREQTCLQESRAFP